MMKHNVPVQSLIDHIKTALDVDPWAKEMAEELLKEQPEIVRCISCTFYRSDGKCALHNGKWRPDGFCSWAIRKEGR